MKANKKLFAVGATLVVVGAGVFGFEMVRHQQPKYEKIAEYTMNFNEPTREDVIWDEYFENMPIEVVTGNQVTMPINEWKRVVSVPSVGILTPYGEGTDMDTLHVGAGHFEGTAEPGEPGVFAVCGHASEVYSCIFNNLKDVKLYDIIEIYDANGKKVDYTVTGVDKVDPDDWSVVDNGTTRKTVMLMTCCDNGHKRYVVFGEVLSEDDVKNMRENRHRARLDVAEQYVKNYKIGDLLKYL